MDLSGLFPPFLILMCLILVLWKKKKRIVLAALIYAFIEVWVEPCFPQPTPTGKFVFVGTKVLLVFFISWVLIKTEKSEDES